MTPSKTSATSLDRWLSMNGLDPHELVSAELLEVAPACVIAELDERLCFQCEYDAKWQAAHKPRQ